MKPPDPEALPTSVEFAHDLMAARLRPGDWVVDGTAGNGHDTAFLAGLVGESGRVFAFDLQEAAIASTRAKLDGMGLLARCTLICDSHHRLADHLPAAARGQLAGVMFNLGWLPGHDKTCITRPETTLTAIQTALDWLRDGGLLTIVAYPGHAGGDTEAAAVGAWASELPSNAFEVRLLRPANRHGKSPECWAIRKRPLPA